MLNNTQTYSDMWQTYLTGSRPDIAEEFEKWFQPIIPLELTGRCCVEGPQRKLCPPDREELHPVPQTDHISQLYGQQTRLHLRRARATAPAVPVAADADTTAISRFNTQTNTANIKSCI